jgi:hypothetical protein
MSSLLAHAEDAVDYRWRTEKSHSGGPRLRQSKRAIDSGGLIRYCYQGAASEKAQELG